MIHSQTEALQCSTAAIFLGFLHVRSDTVAKVKADGGGLLEVVGEFRRRLGAVLFDELRARVDVDHVGVVLLAERPRVVLDVPARLVRHECGSNQLHRKVAPLAVRLGTFGVMPLEVVVGGPGELGVPEFERIRPDHLDGAQSGVGAREPRSEVVLDVCLRQADALLHEDGALRRHGTREGEMGMEMEMGMGMGMGGDAMTK